MIESSEIEFYILVDENGDFVFSKDSDDLVDVYAAEIGPVPSITRVFSLQLTVPTPGATSIRAQVNQPDGPLRVTVG